MTEPKSVESAVEAAFEAETQETPTPAQEQAEVETPAEAPAEQVAPAEPAPEQAPAPETPVDAPKDTPADEAPAPQQLKGDFAHNKWSGLDKDTKDELSRLCAENERVYKRAAEAEYTAKTFRKTIEPVQGYISECAETGKISDAEVIRNCVELVQNLNDKPDITARQMIAGGLVRFTDPVAVIKEIAHAYGLDLSGELREKDIPMSAQVDAARAKYEARQSRFVKPEDVDAEKERIISEYITNTPSINAIYTDPATRDRFIRQVSMERGADPYASDITIINRAAEIFADMVAQKPVAPEAPKPTMAEQKMSKVVAPKASNPADVPSKAPAEEWTAENNSKKSGQAAMDSVRAAMRSLGLDE